MKSTVWLSLTTYCETFDRMYKVCRRDLTEIKQFHRSPVTHFLCASIIFEIFHFHENFFKQKTDCKTFEYRCKVCGQVELGQLGYADLEHALESFAMKCSRRSNCFFHKNMKIQNILFVHKKWVSSRSTSVGRLKRFANRCLLDYTFDANLRI